MIYYSAPLWKSKWILESARLFKSRPERMIYENDTENPAGPHCKCVSVSACKAASLPH